VTFSDLTLTEIRRELLALTAQADLAAGNTRHPSTINGPAHPMPGPEWHIPTRSRPWTVRALTNAADSDCVFVNTPGHMPDEYTALDTANARAVALALLAACDYADHVRAGLSAPRAAKAAAGGLRLVERAKDAER